MTKAIWIIFILFVIGNALFVLPVQISNSSISSSSKSQYKKDSVLIKTVFPDSPVCLKLNMLAKYNELYKSLDSSVCISGRFPPMLVNTVVNNDVSFLALSVPFYKSTNFTGEIAFTSIVKISDQPGRDSIALNGKIDISGKVTVFGICTPLYVKKLVEKEMMDVLRQEMNTIKLDLNKPVVEDTIPIEIKPVLPLPFKSKKAKKR